jgi:hypothetical protein
MTSFVKTPTTTNAVAWMACAAPMNVHRPMFTSSPQTPSVAMALHAPTLTCRCAATGLPNVQATPAHLTRSLSSMPMSCIARTGNALLRMRATAALNGAFVLRFPAQVTLFTSTMPKFCAASLRFVLMDQTSPTAVQQRTPAPLCLVQLDIFTKTQLRLKFALDKTAPVRTETLAAGKRRIAVATIAQIDTS